MKPAAIKARTLSISAGRKKNGIILHRVINLIYEDSTCSFAPHVRHAIEFSNSRSCPRSRVSVARPVGRDRSVFATWCASVTRYRVRITVEEFLFRDRRDTRRIRVSVNGWELHSLRVLLLSAPLPSPRFDRFPIVLLVGKRAIIGCFTRCVCFFFHFFFFNFWFFYRIYFCTVYIWYNMIVLTSIYIIGQCF